MPTFLYPYPYPYPCCCVCAHGRQLYPGACTGIFFDEAPYLLNDPALLATFQAHNAFAHATFDSDAEVSYCCIVGVAPNGGREAAAPTGCQRWYGKLEAVVVGANKHAVVKRFFFRAYLVAIVEMSLGGWGWAFRFRSRPKLEQLDSGITRAASPFSFT